MPEIAEVARIVHHLRKSLVGKTLKKVVAQDDPNVFGKVGTSGAEVQKALVGKKVLDAGQQGKYFWLIMASPPHLVMHFGMTGWLYIKGEPSIHYRPKSTDDAEQWPPKFWKFALETEGDPKIEAAFTDARRFARVRLVDCAAEDIRKTTPLKENGPDPVIDKDTLTEEWLVKKMNSKHVPVKALLLDQANISGIGNWVGDEILYHARLHPEQYSDTFSAVQLKQLHTSIRYVCQTAVDFLGDSSKFPDEWLFNHRWGKGKKDAPTTLPNGEKITFLTVGGRTSCVVPSLQKKTGLVAGDIKANGNSEAKDTAKRTKSKKKVEKEEISGASDVEEKPVVKSRSRKVSLKLEALKTEPESKSRNKKGANAIDDTPPIKSEPSTTSSKGRGQKRKHEVANHVNGEDSGSKKRKAIARPVKIKPESQEEPISTTAPRRSGRSSRS